MISIFSLAKGSLYISFEDIWLAIFRRDEEINKIIIWDLRLHSSISSLLVGSALGMYGVLLQGILKNGLNRPYLFGISAGSVLVIVAFISFGLAQIFIPIAALLSAIFTTLIIFTHSKSVNKIYIERLILGGFAISSLFGAIQATLLLQPEDGRIQSALTLLIVTLNSRGWHEIKITWIPILLSVILSLLLFRQLNLLSLGDELLMSLGNSFFRSRCLK